MTEPQIPPVGDRSTTQGGKSLGGSFRASIATVLSVVFGVLLLVAGGTILQVGMQTGLESVSALTADKVVLILNTVTSRLRDHLIPAQRITENLAQMMTAGSLDPGDTGSFPAALESALSAAPQVRSVVFLDTRGIAKGFHVSKSGAEFEIEDWSGDEEVFRALRNLRQSGETIWGPPVYVENIDVTVLNVRTPVFRGRRFLGGFVAAVGVDELSRHLGNVRASAGEVPFVLSGPDQVIAHPTLGGSRSGRTSAEPLLPLRDLHDPILMRMWDEKLTRPARRVPLPAGYEALALSVPTDEDDQDYIIVSKREYGLGDIPWTVGVHFPADAIGAQIIRQLRASVAGIILLGIGIVATVLIAKAIARPLHGISAAANKLEAAGPDGVDMLPSSHFREIDAANSAFNKMVLGMRDRELVLNLFGRFVPEEVARSLVADRGSLEPQTRVATVFFSDIAGFSTLAEGMNPEALNQLLNDYFELLGSILSHHNGVIQQFQGDGILATFNMPVPDPDHAANAVRAAMEIQHALDGHEFREGLTLPTRIGINTGTMVGGTVGSQTRKSYTVHGDVVNVASRIEQMNKQYKTTVLVAESTVEAAGDAFRFEPMGEVPVRGRNQRVRLYRVLDSLNRLEADTCEVDTASHQPKRGQDSG